MRLRRLNDAGIEVMTRFVESWNADVPEPRPDILFDEKYSSDLPERVIVDAHPAFRRRFELASYIHHILSQTKLGDVRRDKGLWSWWALAWFDVLTASGKTKPGDIARWIPQTDNSLRYYRHLMLGPYLIYSLYAPEPTRALALLAQPPDKPGDIVEQIGSRARLVTAVSIVELATQLYVDANGRVKPRASANARRLADVLGQLGLTFDLHTLSAVELRDLLPKEFAEFQE